jgi:hypothetical protein
VGRRREADEQQEEEAAKPEAQAEAAKKLSPTQQWMLDHPNDVPCPKTPNAAQAWRKKRGIESRKHLNGNGAAAG